MLLYSSGTPLHSTYNVSEAPRWTLKLYNTSKHLTSEKIGKCNPLSNERLKHLSPMGRVYTEQHRQPLYTVCQRYDG